jgi:hypothetical protein
MKYFVVDAYNKDNVLTERGLFTAIGFEAMVSNLTYMDLTEEVDKVTIEEVSKPIYMAINSYMNETFKPSVDVDFSNEHL